MLTTIPVGELSERGRSLASAQLERMSAHLEALKVELTAAIAGPPPVVPSLRPDDFASHEISAATNRSLCRWLAAKDPDWAPRAKAARREVVVVTHTPGEYPAVQFGQVVRVSAAYSEL